MLRGICMIRSDFLSQQATITPTEPSGPGTPEIFPQRTKPLETLFTELKNRVSIDQMPAPTTGDKIKKILLQYAPYFLTGTIYILAGFLIFMLSANDRESEKQKFLKTALATKTFDAMIAFMKTGDRKNRLETIHDSMKGSKAADEFEVLYRHLMKAEANIDSATCYKPAHLQKLHVAIETVQRYAWDPSTHNSKLQEFMKELAKMLVENVDGMETYKKLGKLDDSHKISSLKDACELIRTKVKYTSTPTKILSNLLFHPENLRETIRSRYEGVHYIGSNKNGNIPTRAWTFEGPNGKKVHALLRPLVDLHSDPYLESNPCFLSIGLQSPSQGKGERQRVEYMSQQHGKESVSTANLPLDGPSWKLKPTQNENYSHFLQRYNDSLSTTTDPGYQNVPPSIKNKALDLTKSLFASLGQQPITDADAQMMKYAFLLFIDFAMLQQFFNDLPENQSGFMQIACKQSIDRGATMSSAFYLFYQHAKGQINQDTMEEVIGVMNGRAQLVENRFVMKHRLTPFFDLLTFLSTDQNAEKLKQLLNQNFPFLLTR
jgi:hypothetical protein